MLLFPDGDGSGGVGGAGDGGNPPVGVQKYQVKVDGERKEYTLEELQQQTALAGGAQKRLAEAAEERKKAGAALRLQELMTRMNSDTSVPLTTSELEEVALGQGLRGTQVSEFVQLCQQAYDEAARAQAGGASGPVGGQADGGDGNIDTSGGPKGKQFIGWDDMDPAFKREFQGLRDRENKRDVDTYRDSMMKSLENILDKDEVFGTLIKDNPKMRGPLFEFVKKEITAAIATGGLDGAQLRSSVVQSVRERLQELGIGQPAKDPDRGYGGSSLGPAEGSNLALTALGGGGEPPPRVAATNPKAESVFHARLLGGFRKHLKLLGHKG